MKILVACEYSGRVREAFRKRGHNAVSCDFEPTDIPGQHWQGDVMEIIGLGFDMLIAFPPCTFVTASASRWLKDQPKPKSGALVGAERREAQRQAVEFVKKLWAADIPKKAIENPIGNLSTLWQPPTQIVQPYQFGHGETKATCLWLDNLPPLVPTDIVSGRENKIHKMSGGNNAKRSKLRSLTYQGIASAMAEQWG